MDKLGQQEIIQWGLTAIVLLIIFYIFFQIGQSFCSTDKNFCGYFGTLIAAFIAGIVFYLKFGNRR